MMKDKAEKKQPALLSSITIVFIGYVLFNLNKKCLTHLFPHLFTEFQMNQKDAGTIASSQHLSISVVTFLGGILTDFIPSRVLFPFGLVLCGLTTFLLSLGHSVSYFSVVWFLNGIGHGFELPTAIRLTKSFSSSDKFSTNWSLVLSAVNIAGVINPSLLTFMGDVFGWRTTVRISAILTLAGGLIIFYLFNSKSSHSNDRIIPLHGESTTNSRSGFQVWKVLSVSVLWIVVINRFVVSICRLAVADWSQIYFKTEKNLGPYYGSLFVTIYELSGIFGKLLSGRANDYCVKNNRFFDSIIPVRIALGISFHLVNLLAMILFEKWLGSTTGLLTIGLIAILGGLSSSSNVITFSVLSTEIGDKRYTGFFNSICNLSTKVGAFFSGYPFMLAVSWGGWDFGYNLIIWFTLTVFLIDVCYFFRLKQQHSTKYRLNKIKSK